MNEARDKAFRVYLKTCLYNSSIFDSERKRAFEAGWAARKQAELEVALALKLLALPPKYEDQPG
jgi:hypothetical protein